MKVVCIRSFTEKDLPAGIFISNEIRYPKEGEIFHVVDQHYDEGGSFSKPGTYYTFAEINSKTWYHADWFRRVTDISSLQALTVIKTKQLEDA